MVFAKSGAVPPRQGESRFFFWERGRQIKNTAAGRAEAVAQRQKRGDSAMVGLISPGHQRSILLRSFSIDDAPGQIYVGAGFSGRAWRKRGGQGELAPA